MKAKIRRLGEIFSMMVKNANEFGSIWKNIEPGKEAFAIMQELPDTVAGEFETPAAKAELLENMLMQMEETMSARFCIGVREYINKLKPDDADNKRQLEKLRDFTDLSLPMEEYCRKYGRHLKFDPVERTAQWEEIIADVERECDQQLQGEPRGMGFCFGYWHVRGNVLAERGINWKSPAVMNPGVMFD